jgi:hypothetical protein
MFSKEQQKIVQKAKQGQFSQDDIYPQIHAMPEHLCLQEKIDFMCYEPAALQHAIEHYEGSSNPVGWFHVNAKKWHQQYGIKINYEFRKQLANALGSNKKERKNIMFDDDFQDTKTYPASGPYAICEQEKQDILKSRAYYEGRYTLQPGDHIISQEYLDFLRRKANL